MRTKKAAKTFFRIIKADGTIKFAGTGKESSFKEASRAKYLCDYTAGESVYETDGVRLLWEVL